MQTCVNRWLVNVDTEAILNVKSENILFETFDLNRVVQIPEKETFSKPEEWQEWLQENWGTDRNCIYNRGAVWSTIRRDSSGGFDSTIWKMMDWKHPHLFMIEFDTANQPPTQAVKHLARMNPSALILQEYWSDVGFSGTYLFAGGALKRGMIDWSEHRVNFISDWYKFSDIYELRTEAE